MPLATSAWEYSSAMTWDSVKLADPTTIGAPPAAELDPDPEAAGWPRGLLPPLLPPQAASNSAAMPTPAVAMVLVSFIGDSIFRPD